MAKKLLRSIFALLLVFSLFGVMLTAAATPTADDSVVCVSGFASYIGASKTPFSRLVAARSANVDYGSLKLYVGGIPFGVKFMTDGVTVTGLADVKTERGSVCPAKDAGLRQDDIILKINNETVADAAHISSVAENGGGAPIKLVYSRDGKQTSTTLTPAYCKDEGKYKTGMYVRDSGAGIGTVTYIVPQTLSFGGLGHGICDSQSGKLVSMQRGSVVGVTISGVVKGISGTPGEVRGYFSSGKTGTLLQNTDCGVFGAFASLPSGLASEPIAVGTRNELKAGKAYIYSTVEGTTPQKYEIEISNIQLDSMTNKCFTVKVTDQALIQKTGGIIQGMSGSPIIQNGKLVGAVTHVLINDPTTGYGIFIENMLTSVQIPMAKAS